MTNSSEHHSMMPSSATKRARTETAVMTDIIKEGEGAMSLSFAGCGFLGIYHVGVAAAIREYLPELTSKGHIAGCSAGGLAAAALLCNSCLGQSTTDVLKLVMTARATTLGVMHPRLDLMQTLRDALEAMLPHDAHVTCTGRLYLSLTRFADGKNVVLSDFASKEELIQALICSSFIPFYCGGAVPPALRGVRYMDGGFSLNQLQLDANTITVSPFSGEADICPTDEDSASFLGMIVSNTSFRFTARNLYRAAVALFPPHPEVMSRMCRQGFEDTLRYLARNDLISCARCLAIRSVITVPDEQQLATVGARRLVDRGTDAEEQPRRPMVDTSRPLTKRTSTYTSSGRIRQMSTMSTSSAHEHAHDSECESCRETVNVAPLRGLPHVVIAPLSKAAAPPPPSLLSFVWDSPCVRYARYAALPFTLPWQYSAQLAIRVITWLPRAPWDVFAVARSTSEFVRFLLAEMNDGRHLYSARFTCQLAVTELNFTNNTLAVPSMLIRDVTLAEPYDMPDAMPPRTASFASLQTTASGSVDHRASVVFDQVDTSFGCTVDLSTRARPVRDMVNIMRNERVHEHDDDVSSAPFHTQSTSYAAQVAHTVTELCSAAITKSSTTDNTVDGPSDDVETLQSIVDYSRQHDALMSYYYMDDKSGQMKVTEIFGVSAASVDQPPSLSGTRSPRRRSIIAMDAPRKHSAIDLAVPPLSESSTLRVDSGVETSNTRDACTSPIAQQRGTDDATTTTTYGNRALGMALRRNRHGRPVGAIIGGTTLELVAEPSGGAEESTDDDRLFVPSRRHSRRVKRGDEEADNE